MGKVSLPGVQQRRRGLPTSLWGIECRRMDDCCRRAKERADRVGARRVPRREWPAIERENHARRVREGLIHA